MTLRSCTGVTPVEVAGDGGVLLGVAAVISAREREVAQRGELALDPVQPVERLLILTSAGSECSAGMDTSARLTGQRLHGATPGAPLAESPRAIRVVGSIRDVATVDDDGYLFIVWQQSHSADGGAAFQGNYASLA
jgi:hypothetical protein